ncbi:hypothetical protein GGTG_10721 [Gaeumannomyces tritici R3-111a-1]|uniref:Uncharacterized protein n=1 Tax=Gaeumannomyces tritici (strain R3-111a-1) TaxID=644352 RepID=J3PB48_GAET3|nr:hypothetical protein GGTG_10721 [Gaeumannomyces tritici R3-111a-1]EJT71464.1 hypothetical protein GGTG_10721 [Gaeumannomyces tritici R3-111a-1]
MLSSSPSSSAAAAAAAAAAARRDRLGLQFAGSVLGTTAAALRDEKDEGAGLVPDGLLVLFVEEEAEEDVGLRRPVRLEKRARDRAMRLLSSVAVVCVGSLGRSWHSSEGAIFFCL